MLGVLQGHALYTRQAGSTIPCPYVDYDKGFNAVFARAYGLKDGETISKLFGSDWGMLEMHCMLHCMTRWKTKLKCSGHAHWLTCALHTGSNVLGPCVTLSCYDILVLVHPASEELPFSESNHAGL